MSSSARNSGFSALAIAKSSLILKLLVILYQY
jgi:hypothetical protein